MCIYMSYLLLLARLFPLQHKVPLVHSWYLLGVGSLYVDTLRAAREGTASSSSSLLERLLIGCQWHHPLLVRGTRLKAARAKERGNAARPGPAHRRAGPHCTDGARLILMRSRIGSDARQSRCATSVGWQSSFNIISGESRGKSTKKCCRSTTPGRTEWRQRCLRAETTNPSTVTRDTHR